VRERARAGVCVCWEEACLCKVHICCHIFENTSVL